MPVSGPMDAYSHRLANQVLGNDPMAAALEITLLGPELLADGDLDVRGCRRGDRRDGRREAGAAERAVPRRRRARGCAAARAAAGTRMTLAVEAGSTCRPTLGSRATHLVSRMGPFGGRALRAGDVLPVGSRRLAGARGSPAIRSSCREGGARAARAAGRASRTLHRTTRGGCWCVRGSPSVRNPTAWATASTVRRSAHAGAADILSEAMPFGAIQVPASGQPILLMAERETTGGYATIANVITADLPIAGQLAPGDWIEFEPVDARRGDRGAAAPRSGAAGG